MISNDTGGVLTGYLLVARGGSRMISGGTFLGKVYTDGSRLDGPSPLLPRNGWGFVVRNDDNVVIASASGLPPGWVDDIPGTEAWALAQAAMHAELGCVSFVDCKPCVDAFHDGPEACRAANKPLARVPTVKHVALDDVQKGGSDLDASPPETWILRVSSQGRWLPG